MSKERNLGGRETTYTEERAAKVLEAIATHDLSMTELHDLYDWFPTKQTFFSWTAKHKGLLDLYLEAKKNQQLTMNEKLADLAKVQTYIDERGVERVDPGMAAVAKLQIHTAQWQMARLAPKHFADKAREEVVVKIAAEDLLKKKQELEDLYKKDC